MNSRRLLQPLLVLAILWLAFAALRVASPRDNCLRACRRPHFAANGEPNGWETPAGYVRFTLIFGAVVPAFILLTFFLIRFCNGWGLNIPHKDYWLAPERREETFAFVQRQGNWFAGLLIAFFAGMHWIRSWAPIPMPRQ